jgi:hypothetical protein
MLSIGMKFVDFNEILKVIKKGFSENKKIEIYYPKTENNPAGWRQITLESITTDIPPEGEELVVDKDRISPGHILNAYDLAVKEKKRRSFILGKIKNARF